MIDRLDAYGAPWPKPDHSDMSRLDFLPGMMCDERLWTKVVDALAGRFDACFIPVEKAASREQMREAITRHSGSPAHLIGFSMGGYLALEYTLAFPERVASLTLVGSSAKGLDPDERLQRQKLIGWLGAHAYDGMTQSRLAKFVHPSRMQDPEVVGVIRAMERSLGKPTLLAQLRETAERPTLIDRLPELECPVCLVAAEEDRMVPLADIEQMQRAIPGSELHVLAATGHMVPLEAPLPLATLIDAFQESLR